MPENKSFKCLIRSWRTDTYFYLTYLQYAFALHVASELKFKGDNFWSLHFVFDVIFALLLGKISNCFFNFKFLHDLLSHLALNALNALK